MRNTEKREKISSECHPEWLVKEENKKGEIMNLESLVRNGQKR